ncbi:FliA/WhiG family RNA polymerase sigma factor [Proteiniborus sp.]|uniref:FliA/WhiG family RNA polymerase sigma factor n=1 Tax=Proteiniborus sp. TaxID=2079015 RepID=UPI00331B9DD9
MDELWKLYKETKDIGYKQSLIEQYLQLVKIVAGRMYNFYGGNVEYDDLIGFGVFGLIDAIDKFDISRDLKFETYAQIRIRGSIIDSLRKIDWVPRGLRKKAKEIESAIYVIENKLGRSANIKEIAAELKIDEKELENTLSEVSAINVLSLEEVLVTKGDIYLKLNDKESPEEMFEIKELKYILKEAIEKLSEKEKLVVSLYYFEELTYKEIAKILEVSESRISQIHSKAILSLKNLLTLKGVGKY